MQYTIEENLEQKFYNLLINEGIAKRCIVQYGSVQSIEELAEIMTQGMESTESLPGKTLEFIKCQGGHYYCQLVRRAWKNAMRRALNEIANSKDL